MTLRLIAYNIMAGGIGRADPIAEVLRVRRPDIVGLHEATDNETLARIAKRLNLNTLVAGSVAIATRFEILDSIDLGRVYGSAMPALDVTLDVGNGRELFVRVAHLVDRVAGGELARELGERRPDVMLMSFDPPAGKRVVDNVVGPAEAPAPTNSVAPVRQLDTVMTGPRLKIVESWVEMDRLAFYASDHLPGGAAVEFVEFDA